VNGRADGGLVALYIDERVRHVGNDNRQSIATIDGLFCGIGDAPVSFDVPMLAAGGLYRHLLLRRAGLAERVMVAAIVFVVEAFEHLAAQFRPVHADPSKEISLDMGDLLHSASVSSSVAATWNSYVLGSIHIGAAFD